MPPPGMPAFSEEKLSDADVQALAEYIRPKNEKTTGPDIAPVPVTPLPAVAAPVPATSVSVSAGPERTQATAKQKKTKRIWHKGLAGTWTIKSRQDNEVITFRQFKIAANANDQPEIELVNDLSDYTVKVTALNAAGRTLKLELTWGWKLNPQYWKIETFDLRLSGGGRKLTGTRAFRTSSGQNAIVDVWGE